MAAADKPRARILHAEDQPIVAEAIELVLGDAGFVVARAADGREALDKITAQPDAFDLVLTDDDMPRLSGLELVRELRRLKFAGRIIVLSGVVNSEKERSYRQLGIRTILEKPFQVRDLVRAIEEELSA
jgi:CheY-like chemotaxis protein